MTYDRRTAAKRVDYAEELQNVVRILNGIIAKAPGSDDNEAWKKEILADVLKVEKTLNALYRLSQMPGTQNEVVEDMLVEGGIMSYFSGLPESCQKWVSPGKYDIGTVTGKRISENAEGVKKYVEKGLQSLRDSPSFVDAHHGVLAILKRLEDHLGMTLPLVEATFERSKAIVTNQKDLSPKAAQAYKNLMEASGGITAHLHSLLFTLQTVKKLK